MTVDEFLKAGAAVLITERIGAYSTTPLGEVWLLLLPTTDCRIRAKCRAVQSVILTEHMSLIVPITVEVRVELGACTECGSTELIQCGEDGGIGCVACGGMFDADVLANSWLTAFPSRGAKGDR